MNLLQYEQIFKKKKTRDDEHFEQIRLRLFDKSLKLKPKLSIHSTNLGKK